MYESLIRRNESEFLPSNLMCALSPTTIYYTVLTMPLTTDPSLPAKLLSQLSLYPNPSLWGFPIKSSHILVEFHKTITPETDDDSHLISYCSNYFSDLKNQCNDIWTSPKLRAACRQVRVNGKPMIIVAHCQMYTP